LLFFLSDSPANVLSAFLLSLPGDIIYFEAYSSLGLELSMLFADLLLTLCSPSLWWVPLRTLWAEGYLLSGSSISEPMDNLYLGLFGAFSLGGLVVFYRCTFVRPLDD